MRSRAVVKPRFAFLSADRARAFVAGSRIVVAAWCAALLPIRAGLRRLRPDLDETFAPPCRDRAAWRACSMNVIGRGWPVIGRDVAGGTRSGASAGRRSRRRIGRRSLQGSGRRPRRSRSLRLATGADPRQACLIVIRSMMLATSSALSIAASRRRVDLLPLDQLDRVAAAREEVGDGLAGELVALVLEPVDLDPVLLQALEAAQVRERLVELLALLDDDRRPAGSRPAVGASIAVQDERVRGLLDEVDDVVEGADQGVDVLAVERGDERRLEPPADLVAELVAAVLGVADLPGALLGGVVRAEHRLEQPGRPEDVRRVLREHVEEALFAGDQAEPHGRRVARRVATAAGRRVRCSRRGRARHRVRRAPGDRARGRARDRVVARPDARGDRRIAARGGARRRHRRRRGRAGAGRGEDLTIGCAGCGAAPRRPSSGSSSGCATSPTSPTSSASGSSG